MFDDDSNGMNDNGNYQNGPTDHGTFVGTCQNCGIVWEFENYEVIPAPCPRGSCPLMPEIVPCKSKK